MVTIKSIEDFKKLKEFLVKPLCYVYYKNTLLDSYYVGFTTQNAYKYLKNHHKMKDIDTIINSGFTIQIYTKYNEKSLIKFFKPKLNKINGSGKCGRNIGGGNLKCIGEVISMTVTKKNGSNTLYKKERYNFIYSLYDTIWENAFKHKRDKMDKVSINFDIICYIIEKESMKDINKIYDQILNNELFIQLTKESQRRKKKSWSLLNTLGKIIKFCKINMIFKSYIIINQIFLSYIKNIIEKGHDNCHWYDLLYDNDNYKLIHNEIINQLKLNNCMIDINKTNFNSIIGELSYFYRFTFIQVFNPLTDTGNP